MTTNEAQTKAKAVKVPHEMLNSYNDLSRQLSELSAETMAVPEWIRDGEHKKMQAFVDKLHFLGGHLQNCGIITQAMF